MPQATPASSTRRAPVVRFMVEVTDPQLGETVLDPGLRHWRLSGRGVQPPRASRSRPWLTGKMLQERSLFGGEPKSLPYLLCQMNLLLHGLDAPQIDPGNSLRFKLSEIGEKDRVDVILTNPPFGGEEEKGIQGNFPEDRQTVRNRAAVPATDHAEAAPAADSAQDDLRARPWSCPTARCSATACAPASRRNCSRTSTCTPSCACPTACSRPTPASRPTCCSSTARGPTKDVWYYEHPLPEGRKNYTKTAPIQFEEFAPCMTWWTKREENERAWKVPLPSCWRTTATSTARTRAARKTSLTCRPSNWSQSILHKEQRIAEIMGDIKTLLAQHGA